jgi:hypothetical protein
MLSGEAFHQLVQVGLTLPIPGLLLLASRNWAKHVRKDLPRWRNILGAVSISIASFNSLLLLATFLLPLTHSRLELPGKLFLSIFFSAPVGVALGLSLRGLPRLQTILAGAITIALWFANIDFI